MVGERAQKIGVTVTQYGVVYPGIVALGLYLTALYFVLPYDTVLFAVFAAVAVLTGFGTMSGTPSGDARHHGGGFFGTSDPGESWASDNIVKMILFDIGLATVLTIYTLWWY